MARAAFPILDEYEDEDWDRREAGKDPPDDQAAVARDADYLARLLLACENDVAVLTDVIQVWYESRRKPFDSCRSTGTSKRRRRPAKYSSI